MSYSNNWLESISEAYKSKTKKKENHYVKEDTETLLAIIEVLCEELNIDAEELLLEATGNPAPYGYHVKNSPSGRKRYIPKTEEQWRAESEKFHAKNPDHWERMEAFQKANPLNPDRDDHITGPDDHLPGGVGKKAREERRAAIAAHRAK